MSAPSNFTPQEQFQALNVLDFLSDLFTAADESAFTREIVLLTIDNVKSVLFDPDVVIAQQEATRGM